MSYRHSPGQEPGHGQAYGHGPGPVRQPERDLRLGASSRIWMWAMIMVGISVPVCAITDSAAVPLCAILGAALSSACVWIFGGPGSQRDPAERAALQQSAAETARLQAKVDDLEERLFSLETIGRYEQARHSHASSTPGAPDEQDDEALFGGTLPPQPPARDPLLPTRAAPNPSQPSQPIHTGRSATRPRNPGALEG